MELFIGLVVAAIVVYFVFFRKPAQVATPVVEEVKAPAPAPVVEEAKPVAKKKPTVKKATSKPAPKAAAKKKAPAKK